MKIIAVGMNYALHNQELGHTSVNKEPVIFMKPDSAILKDGKPFFIPDFSNEVHYETELVVRINRLGKNISPRFASRYYDACGSGRCSCDHWKFSKENDKPGSNSSQYSRGGAGTEERFI